ncbi:helix-turn-helix domain-containing protein [Vibrio renipiscarius]|uniref:Transcriptional regulator n=1 Tax=Vibrio renipiscarius TaxID=1461322 RepID=A0A0C2N6Q9_9VIBR|nr:helix-turn-helix transcriptional regulator [Vibrio renipiscarius]KII75316.1 transcriptional regulator [Vibrio renipiscarius]KII78768.1 transcriptional regulator [Vibrio renipiscarius]
MIKCHLSKLLGAKKLKIADVVRETGVNRSTVNRLFHETNHRIDFETLEKICLYLECTVGELLEVQVESEAD